MILIVFFYSLLLLSKSEHPCQDPKDIIFNKDATNSFCYRNFGDGNHNRIELLENCTNWFHSATPVGFKDIEELDFFRNNVTTDGKKSWTGLHKTEYLDCDLVKLEWDNGGDITFVEDLPKNCLSEHNFCFYLNESGYLTDMYCSKPTVSGYLESICYFKIPICDGVLGTNSSTVCNGHGECLEDEKCICEESSGYTGVYCDSFEISCFGYNQKDIENVCSGHGNCSYQDHCVCYNDDDDDYVGSNCEYLKSEEYQLCDPLKNETEYNGYCYKNFGFIESFSYSSDSSELFCSNNWILSGSSSTNNPYQKLFGNNNNIKPHLISILNFEEENFVRNNLIINEEQPIWLGLKKKNESFLIDVVCPPEYGYIWYSDDYDYDYDTTEEYVISKQSSVVCDSNDKFCFSIFPDEDLSPFLSYSYYWRDEYCDNSTNTDITEEEEYNIICKYKIPECFGIMATDLNNVCSGNGICGSIDNCSCINEGYFGPQCQEYSCFGITINDVFLPLLLENNNDPLLLLCSGHGSCDSPDHCICEDGYRGKNCSIPRCFGVFDDDEEEEDLICSGHGNCIDLDQCECESYDYGGEECEYTYQCIHAKDIVNSTNSSRPYCYRYKAIERNYYEAEEYCNSDIDFYDGGHLISVENSDELAVLRDGSYGSDFLWIGLQKQNTEISSPVMNTVPPSGWYWTETSASTNYIDTFPNNFTSVMDEYSKCIYMNETNVMSDGPCLNSKLHFICRLNLYQCYGKFSHQLDVCNGNGFCVAKDTCVCKNLEEGAYITDDCQVTNCYGIYSNDTSNVCSGHGICTNTSSNVSVCHCDLNYYGLTCNITSCNGIFTNQTDDTNTSTAICGGKGSCEYYDVCECEKDYYGSQNCSITTCYGYFSNDIEFVCSGHGECISPNNCTCESNDSYSGDWCQITTCNSISSTDEENVCNGRGKCENFDDCFCDKNYYGDFCNITTCDGTFSNDTSSNPCSLGNGICWPFEVCTCNENGYFSNGNTEYCELTTCYGILSKDVDYVCSGHGNCSQLDTCECNNTGHYFGTECEITYCNGTLSNDTESVCSGHGTCWEFDECECDSIDYWGKYCEITEGPYWLMMYNLNDCGGNDVKYEAAMLLPATPNECISLDRNSRLYDYNETTLLVDYYANSENCTGPSLMIDPIPFETCLNSGQPNYYERINTNFTFLRSLFPEYSNSFVLIEEFSEFGDGVDYDKCISNDVPYFSVYPVETCINRSSTYFKVSLIQNGYGGNDCSVRIQDYQDSNCTNPSSIDEVILSQDCVANPFSPLDHSMRVGFLYDNNLCFPSVYPNLTSINDCVKCMDTCFGNPRFSDPLNTCGGHGTCITSDICQCDDNYYGTTICNITTCDMILSNDTSKVCSNHGICGPVFEICHCEKNYYGTSCNVTKCNGIFSNETACSGRGTCTYFETCECEKNYYSEDCNITKCDGTFSNVTDTCTEYGTCWPFDICQCGSGYFGESCNVTTCFGSYSNVSDDICSTHGVCWPENTCLCDNSGQYFGSDCNYTFCFGFPTNVSGGCSDRGTCWPHNICECDENYFGIECNVTKCYGLYSNDTSNVCNGEEFFESCWPLDHCNCKPNYYGIELCNVTKCNNIFSNETDKVCTDRGTCTYFETCDCETNYYGEDCNITTCDGTFSNLTDTCTEYGTCWPFDICQCGTGYFGESCNVTTCFGSYSNVSDNVCSTHGICWPENTCLCDNTGKYFGSDCNYTFCFGYPTNVSGEGCSDRGVCWPHDVCECDENYFGIKCNVTKCYEIYSNDTSKVCNGDEFFDSCWPLDHCNCKSDYYGLECNITMCNGEYSNFTDSVCSSYGFCWPHEHCNCIEDYYDDDCDVTTCYGIFSNSTPPHDEYDTSLLCSNRGISCWPHDICNCEPQYYDITCNVTECYGYLSNDSNVCSEEGKCVDIDTCHCYEGYFGDTCNITQCNNVWNNDSFVCYGHGHCNIHYQNCSCDTNYTDYNCHDYNCFEVTRFDTEIVCTKGHGSCISHDLCACHTNYTGIECQFFECFGIYNNMTEALGIELDEQVCSGHGTCEDVQNCNCSILYPGDYCNEWSCDSIPKSSIDPLPCHGNGICIDIQTCQCYPDYESADSFCRDFYCDGKHWEEINTVCSGRGECVSPDECICTSDYQGDFCETWSCGMDKDSDGTCSGKGVCISPDVCECDSGFTGELCDYNRGLAVGLGVTLPIITVIGVCSVLCCILCIVICFAIALIIFCGIFMAVVSGFFVVFRFQQGRLKKLDALKDFEHLLQEKKIEENDDIAHIQINKHLFEIEYDDIEMIEIIGKGGSDSTVYRANWRNQEIAFKCFKTSDLCNSQENFEEFEKEVSILSSVSHPNVIRFFGASIKPPRIGIVMEYCENGDLKEYLFRIFIEKYGREYPFGQKIRMLKEIVMAMEYLHARNVIHRDLKLENVLVDEREICKVMDFGLSKVVDRISTKKTMRVGTSIYISPEVVLHGRYNEMCDVYSFAIMMFIIVSGNLYPFGEDETCVELRVAQDPNYRPNIHELDRFMERNPETRFLKRIVQVCWNHDPNRRISFKMIGSFLIKAAAVNRGDDEDLDRRTMDELKELEGPDQKEEELLKQDLTSTDGGEKKLFEQIQELLIKNETLEKDKQMYDIKMVEYKERTEVAEAESKAYQQNVDDLRDENQRLQEQISKMKKKLRGGEGGRRKGRKGREKKAPPVPKKKIEMDDFPRSRERRPKKMRRVNVRKSIAKPSFKAPPVPVDLTKRKMHERKKKKPRKKAPPVPPPAVPPPPVPPPSVHPPPIPDEVGEEKKKKKGGPPPPVPKSRPSAEGIKSRSSEEGIKEKKGLPPPVPKSRPSAEGLKSRSSEEGEKKEKKRIPPPVPKSRSSAEGVKKRDKAPPSVPPKEGMKGSDDPKVKKEGEE